MKRMNTIAIITLLLCSIAASMAFVSAQDSEAPELNVSWQVVSESSDFEHTSERSQWIFGPQPTVWLGYAENLTSTEENAYRVEVGTPLLLNITIPKTFLGEGAELDVVRFWGATYLERSPVFVLEYNATADSWALLSLDYEPGSEEPSHSDFIALYSDESEYSETSEDYQVVFSIEFLELVVEAIFWTGMETLDDQGRVVSPSWLARLESGRFETPPIGLGVEVNFGRFALPEYYYADIVDEAGNLLHYVDSHDNFTFRMRANEPFGRIEVPFAFLTNDSDYVRNYTWRMPKDMYDRFGGWSDWITYMPPMLAYVFNGTHAYGAVSYLDNITWTWSFALSQWTVDYDLLINETLDLSVFYYLKNTSIEHDGAWVSWTGYFTEDVDMNPWDPTKKGGTVTPDPYFWTVLDTDAEPMHASAEIANHNTVRLAYKEMFIEAFLRKDGEIVRRAQQGETLNLTMLIHSPAAYINGSFYIEDNSNPDIDGYLVHIHRHNFSVWMTASGRASNSTHYWRHQTTHALTMDLDLDTAWTNSTTTRWVYTSDHVFVGEFSDESSTLLTVIDHQISIDEGLTTIELDFVFEAEAPSMKIDDAGIASAYSYAIQVNYTDDGGATWKLHPPEVNWTHPHLSGDTIQFLHDEILWSPAHLLLGDVEAWEPQKWTITEEGAIDLDGNIFTTDDQYFVKRTGYWHDHGNVTVEGMHVGINLDPSPGNDGDEFISNSWMGVASMIVEFEANETFYWYRASNFTSVGSAEMQDIKETMYADIDQEIAVPGYDWVAWLSKNRTVDLTAITGLDSNSWETTWFAWGTEQAFRVATNATSTTWAAFRAEYAGLLVFNDLDPDGAGPMEPNGAPDFSIQEGKVVTDEVTHLVLIDKVGSVELRRPFGATNDTGDVNVSPDAEVNFGITIADVQVTLYPLQVENSNGLRGPWAFRESFEGAMGLNSTDFDYWITHADVDEMAFDITFSVEMAEYNPEDESTWNHAAAFKVDQKFGDWALDEFGNEVLEGRSLAVNFFGVLATGTRTRYQAGGKPVTDTNQASVTADYYQYNSEDSPFANVSMGGLPYTWGGDNHATVYTSGSSSAPIGAFSLMYESSSGTSVTRWQVDASMLFMTAGYTNWGGHEIICDPVFVSYTSAHQTPAGPTTTPTTTTTTTTTATTTTTVTPTGVPTDLYIMIGGIVVVLVVIVVLVRRR